MYRVLILTVFSFFFFSLEAQELDCRISVVHSQIQGTNTKVFETLQSALYEFMNNRKWTNHVYSIDERIECNILINLTDQVSADEFRGTIQVQARRPVFNTNYNTVMFNRMDNDLRFRYIEYQPLEFAETSHLSDLTSMLAFYAYIILGLDYDTFSPEGGTEFFQKAETIVNNAQNSPYKGWKAFDSPSHKNRYWLIEGILNDKYSPLRDFLYRYHRQGLDIMTDKPNEGRAEIADAIELLKKIYREKPDPFMPFLRLIIDAKSDEFVKIFSESFPDEKNRVAMILSEIDPSNATKYEKIRNP